MAKISAQDIAKKLKDVYRAKKRDINKVGTGTDIPMPDTFVKAPEVINKLLGMDYPLQRVIQISGAPNSSKTTLGMLAMVEAQRVGMYVVLIDSERKWSTCRFKNMGGDPEDLNIVSAVTLEDGFLGATETINIILSQDPQAKIFVVFDSLGGTPSKAEIETDADETTQLATAAKVIRRELRKFVQMLDKYKIGLMLINQSYAKIGSVGRANSGGEGGDYFSSIIIQTQRTGDIHRQIKGDKVVVGINTKAKVTKHHLMQSEQTLKEVQFSTYAYSIEEK